MPEPEEVHAPDSLALFLAQLRVLSVVVLDEAAGGDDICGGVEQNAVRRAAVPAGAPGLLVVGLET